jgi:thiamine biosynthesis lipoprotein
MTLGALTQIEIRHPDRARARRVLTTALREINRLEGIVSLYRSESALVQLNRDGVVADPPLDLVRVLSEARSFSEITAGCFDVSVQPLWRVYADHFSTYPADSAGPPADAIRRAADLVDYKAIEIDPSCVRLGCQGMALTLNGIAQGYITDRIAELLKQEGFDNVLVDIGEIRAAGQRSVERPWRASIRDPLDSSRTTVELPLVNQALATSGSYGFRFDAGGRFHHIFDPRNGACPHAYASVSIVAPTATAADALATACNLMPPESIAVALRSARATYAIATDRGGATRFVETLPAANPSRKRRK